MAEEATKERSRMHALFHEGVLEVISPKRGKREINCSRGFVSHKTRLASHIGSRYKATVPITVNNIKYLSSYTNNIEIPKVLFFALNCTVQS